MGFNKKWYKRTYAQNRSRLKRFQNQTYGYQRGNIKKNKVEGWDEQEFLSFFTAKAMNEENVNIYNQVYKYVKQKDEYFKDATDC